MKASMGPEAAVYMQMTHDEALVLFDWVQRHEDTGSLDQIVADPAELAVFWSVSCALERLLVEPFRTDYADVLEAARARLRPLAE